MSFVNILKTIGNAIPALLSFSPIDIIYAVNSLWPVDAI